MTKEKSSLEETLNEWKYAAVANHAIREDDRIKGHYDPQTAITALFKQDEAFFKKLGQPLDQRVITANNRTIEALNENPFELSNQYGAVALIHLLLLH